MIRLLLVLVMMAGLTGPAFAHTRSEANSEWSLKDGLLTGAVTILTREATRLPQGSSVTADDFAAYLGQTITAEPCEGAPPHALPASAGHMRVELRFSCPEGEPVTLSIASFFQYMPSHAHYARVRTDGTMEEHVITLASQSITLGGDKGAQEPVRAVTRFTEFLSIGMTHIVSGLDHLAFLLAVILLAGTLRQIAWAITGFTVGHSITLALATFELVSPQPSLVEAGIGFTIALVAVEVAADRTGRFVFSGAVLAGALGVLAVISLVSPMRLPPAAFMGGLALFSLCYFLLAGRLRAEHSPRLNLLRVGVTAMFGLVHGFGFAGNLSGLGFSPDNILPMLIGFNLGVEIGQIGLVAAALVLGFIGMRLVPALRGPVAAEAMAGGLVALGLFWFLDRAYGML